MSRVVIREVRPLAGEAVDIVIDGRVISDVVPAGCAPLQSEDATPTAVLEAANLIALPGLVDLHTHLREPGREDAETVESGTRAAALGGFTCVHAMANTEPGR